MTVAPDPEGVEPGDRSLARERTMLAWTRTGLSMLGAGAAILRLFPPVGVGSHHHSVGWALLALGGFTWLVGMLQYRDDNVPTVDARARRLRSVSITTTAIAAISFGFAVFPSAR